MLRRILVMPIVYGLLVIFAACAQPGQVVVPTAPPATATPAATTTLTQAPPTATATVFPTESPSATPAVPTSTPELETLDTTTTTTTSPDGAWVAVAAVSFPTTKNGVACENCGDQYFARLTVHRADGSQFWTAIAEWRQMGLGYTTPAVLQWSADGAALYYTNVEHPDGCGYSTNGSDLWRLDLATGAATKLPPDSAMWLALSPDETRVAFLTSVRGKPTLGVHDFLTGSSHAYSLEDLGAVDVGAIVWAPDASAVALRVVNNPCGETTDLRQWVLQVTLADGRRRVLLAPEAQALTPLDWPAPDQLILADAAGARWVLQVSTGQLTPEG